MVFTAACCVCVCGGSHLLFRQQKESIPHVHTHTHTHTFAHTPHTQQCRIFHFLHGWELPSNHRDEASPKLSVSLGTSFCKTGAVLLLAKMPPIRLGSHLSTPLGSQKMWQS